MTYEYTIDNDDTCELCGNPIELDRILEGKHICEDCELDSNLIDIEDTIKENDND